MKAHRQMLVALLVLAFVSQSWQSEKLEPESDICRLFADATKLRKPGTCNEGVVCYNFKSTQGVVCSGSTPWYALASNSCVAKQPGDAYCKAPCAKTSPVFVADKKNCHNWYQCDGKTEINKGTCPAYQIFNQKQQQCIYDDKPCVKTYEFCDVAKQDIKFADELNCHKYYACNKKGKADSFTCPIGQYYDRALAHCSSKAQVNCYKHPYPDEVCGNTKIAYRNKFVDDEATCRGYFYCQDKGVGVPDATPVWGQCSVYEFFNPDEQACQLRSHVKCSEDRCDGRLEGEKEISGTKGCQHYLVCGKGYTKAEVYCGDGLYFDPETSQCTTVRRIYEACA